MSNSTRSNRCLGGLTATRLVVLAAAVLAIACIAGPEAEEVNTGGPPAVTITEVAPWGPGGDQPMAPIAGTVRDAPKDARLVLYAHTDVWYVPPYVVAPFTAIAADGRWRTRTHLGAEYAALLVRPGYDPPARLATLPSTSDLVLAVTRVPARR